MSGRPLTAEEMRLREAILDATEDLLSLVCRLEAALSKVIEEDEP